MISEKAVEAAAKAINADRWEAHTDVARAALSAAIPVLLDGKREEIARQVDPDIWAAWDKSSSIIDYRLPGCDDYCKCSLAAADRIISIMGGGE